MADWLYRLDRLFERDDGIDYHDMGDVYVVVRPFRMHTVEWFPFAAALAELSGCCVVWDGHAAHAIGNEVNVEVFLDAHKHCYMSLRKENLALAVQLATQKPSPAMRSSVYCANRKRRLAAEKVAWKIVELFPALRDLAHPNEPVLKAHGGRLQLGGILPTMAEAE